MKASQGGPQQSRSFGRWGIPGLMPMFYSDCRELHHPGGNWIGLYYYLRWSGRAAVDESFNAVAADIPLRLARAAIVYGPRVVWAIAVLDCPPIGPGLPKSNLATRQAIRHAYDRMWSLHSDLWGQMSDQAPTLLSFWLVDVGLRTGGTP